MATIKHDRHEHELKLIKGVDVNMAGKGACAVCEMPLVGASDHIYTCLENNHPHHFFFMHKKCIKLPTQITHLNHPQHPLTLGHRLITQELQSYVAPEVPLCDICLREIDQAMSVYYCEVCSEMVSVSSTKSLPLFKYLLCIRCATVEPVLDHPGHEQHVLALVARLMYSRCDACGLLEYDMCYVCLHCQFWIHVTCAVSPLIIKLRFHEDDTLHLIYSVPPMYRSFPNRCSICKSQVSPDYWAYFCEDSGYFVHIHCANSFLASGNSSEIKCDEENHQETYPDLLHFPLPTTDSLTAVLMAQYHNLIKQEDDDDHTGVDHSEEDEETSLIDHWSHLQHPLILLEELKDAHNDSDHIHDMLVCNGCTQPISNQINYYGCIGCNFFLHISCAQHLPLKLPPGSCVNDPQHSLQLLFQPKTSHCYTCLGPTNGFIYACNICSSTYDMFCCLSPKKIKHDYHSHPLVQQYYAINPSILSSSLGEECNACAQFIVSGFRYRCETCSGIQIHQHCALSFPKTMSHRWDSHIMSLIYPPIYYKGRKYCETCEMEVNKEGWLYRCNNCDHCFHPTCILPPHNMKTGITVDHHFHHHKLTLLMIDTDRYPARINNVLQFCSQGHISNQKFYYQCLGCDYSLCWNCVDGYAKEDIAKPFGWVLDFINALPNTEDQSGA